MSNRDPNDNAPPGGISSKMADVYSKIDAWSDDSGTGDDFAASRAARGLPSREEERRQSSYDDTGPNSREARESEYERMGRRAGSRAAGAGDDEGDGDDVDTTRAVEIIETVASRIGLPEDVAAAIDPAAADIVEDFGKLTLDLHLEENQVAAIGDWLMREASGDVGNATPMSIAELSRALGVRELDLSKMTPGDAAMAGRFVRYADDAGLSIHQLQHLVAWAGKAGANVPAAGSGSGRSASRGGDGGGSGWHASGEGIPAVITKADVSRMSTPQLQQMMRTNFDLYQRSGAQAEYTRRLNRGGR